MARDVADLWGEVYIDVAEQSGDCERDAVDDIADKSEPEDRPLDDV